MRFLLSVALLAACGRDGVRQTGQRPSDPTPPPPHMGIAQVCIGAVRVEDFAFAGCAPEGMRTCYCAAGFSYSFCADPYYFEFFQEEWLGLCPPP
jgi:hypothetical protein